MEKEGFLDFFLPFLERNPVRDIRLIRTIEDGPNVFVHAHQSLNNGEYYYVTADIFDTDDNDKIVEHWDTIQEEVRATASGRSMVDGYTEIEDEEKTEENRQLITSFFDVVLVGGQYEKIEDYISSDEYAQHNPAVEDGLAGFEKFSKELAEKGQEMKYVKVHKVLVKGNFAVSLSHVKVNQEDLWLHRSF